MLLNEIINLDCIMIAIITQLLKKIILSKS